MKVTQRRKRRPYGQAKQAKTIIRRALELLKDGEWAQGDYVMPIADGELGFCALGALRVGAGARIYPSPDDDGGWVVAAVHYKSRDAFNRAMGVVALNILNRTTHYPQNAIMSWNDRCSNVDEVIETFERALNEV